MIAVQAVNDLPKVSHPSGMKTSAAPALIQLRRAK